jgi:hypothetical protein
MYTCNFTDKQFAYRNIRHRRKCGFSYMSGRQQTVQDIKVTGHWSDSIATGKKSKIETIMYDNGNFFKAIIRRKVQSNYFSKKYMQLTRFWAL